MRLSQKLKLKREEKSLTQVEVAEKIYVSQKSISNWETGRNYPDIDSLIRLAKLYDLSLDNLLLEGSDIVENIKEKAEIKSLERISTFAALTSFCLIAIMIGQKWYGELPLIVTLLLTTMAFSNLFIISYFQAKLNKLKDKKVTLKDLLILIIIAVVTAVLYLFYLR